MQRYTLDDRMFCVEEESEDELVTDGSEPDVKGPSNEKIGSISSDVDRLSIVSSDDGGDADDYWFGKKYLAFILAQDVFLNQPCGRLSTRDLDERLEESLHAFPVVQCLEELSQAYDIDISEQSGTGSPYINLVTLIGSLYRLHLGDVMSKVVAMLGRVRDPCSSSPESTTEGPTRPDDGRATRTDTNGHSSSILGPEQQSRFEGERSSCDVAPGGLLF